MKSLKKKFDNVTFVHGSFVFDFIDGMKKPSGLSWKKYFDMQGDNFDYQDLKYEEVKIDFDIDENTLLIFDMVIDPTRDIGRNVYYIKENGKAYLVYPHS